MAPYNHLALLKLDHTRPRIVTSQGHLILHLGGVNRSSPNSHKFCSGLWGPMWVVVIDGKPEGNTAHKR